MNTTLKKETPPVEGGAQKSLLKAIKVSAVLKIIDSDPKSNSFGIVRSRLSNSGTRQIVVTLSRTHPLSGRALRENDTATIKLLSALLITEFTQWWHQTRDARAIKTVLLSQAAIRSDVGLPYWSEFACGLAASDLFNTVDQLPIYGASNSDNNAGPHKLLSFTALLPEISQIPNWRPRSQETAKPKE